MNFLAKEQRIGIAAALLALSAFLSRIMGLVRDKVISWQFGTGSEADMYFAAFVVPDMINYLLAGGFMSITIIPLLSRCFREDDADAWNFFSCIFCWMLTASALLTGLGAFFAENLASLVAPGFTPAQCGRLAFFMRIILPAQIFFLSGSCFTALLFLRRQFSVPALTPLIYNACIIAGGLLCPLFFTNRETGMTGYCAGVTVGACLGAFILPMSVAARQRMIIRPTFRHRLFGKFLLTALPLMLGQTIIMLDEQFLRVFGSLAGEGVVSLLNYGRRIAQVPIGLVGQAMAVASYPFLVSLLTNGENEKFDATLNSTLKTGTALIVPVCAWMCAATWPILCLIFEGGKFGVQETQLAIPLARIQMAMSPFWVVYMVLARGYYAHGDTMSPAVMGTIMTLLCLPCYYWLAVPLGAWAIAALSGLSVGAYVLWLIAYWKRKYGPGALAGLAGMSCRALLCSLPAAGAAWFMANASMRSLDFNPFVNACIATVVSGIVFTALFLPLCRLFAPDIAGTFSEFMMKLGKRLGVKNLTKEAAK